MWYDSVQVAAGPEAHTYRGSAYGYRGTRYQYDTMLNLTEVAKVTDDGTVRTGYRYNKDRLSYVDHNGFSYRFNYNAFGYPAKVEIDRNSTRETLIEHQFETVTVGSTAYHTGRLLCSDYGNGDRIVYTYDREGRVESIRSGDSTQTEEFVRYGYDDRGNLGYKKEPEVTTRYFYDLINRLREVRTSDGRVSVFDLDNNSNLLTLTETLGGTEYQTEHEYDMDNRLTRAYDGHRSQSVVYNTVTGMLESVTITNSAADLYPVTYGYLTGKEKTSKVDSTTGMVGTVISGSGAGTLKTEYRYDGNGNNVQIRSQKIQTEMKYLRERARDILSGS